MTDKGNLPRVNDMCLFLMIALGCVLGALCVPGASASRHLCSAAYQSPKRGERKTVSNAKGTYRPCWNLPRSRALLVNDNITHNKQHPWALVAGGSSGVSWQPQPCSCSLWWLAASPSTGRQLLNLLQGAGSLLHRAGGMSSFCNCWLLLLSSVGQTN